MVSQSGLRLTGTLHGVKLYMERLHSIVLVSYTICLSPPLHNIKSTPSSVEIYLKFDFIVKKICQNETQLVRNVQKLQEMSKSCSTEYSPLYLVIFIWKLVPALDTPAIHHIPKYMNTVSSYGWSRLVTVSHNWSRMVTAGHG